MIISQISLKMCARRAVRVTSVFSSAAASLRVRTERDVCSAENCVKNTSGKDTKCKQRLESNCRNYKLACILSVGWRETHGHTHLTWCCRHHEWLLPSVCKETGHYSPFLDLPLFSKAPVSHASSPSFGAGTLDVLAQSSWIKKKIWLVEDTGAFNSLRTRCLKQAKF